MSNTVKISESVKKNDTEEISDTKKMHEYEILRYKETETIKHYVVIYVKI